MCVRACTVAVIITFVGRNFRDYQVDHKNTTTFSDQVCAITSIFTLIVYMYIPLSEDVASASVLLLLVWLIAGTM